MFAIDETEKYNSPERPISQVLQNPVSRNLTEVPEYGNRCIAILLYSFGYVCHQDSIAKNQFEAYSKHSQSISHLKTFAQVMNGHASQENGNLVWLRYPKDIYHETD